MVLPFCPKAQQNTFTSVFVDPTTSGSSAQAYAAAETEDSGFLAVGYRNLDALILKADKHGALVWDKKINFGFSHAIFYRIIPTDDQNFAVAGTGNSDILVMKITPNGDTLWARSVDFGQSESLTHIEQTDDQGYILCGYGTTGGSTYETRMFVVKLDADGWLEWAISMITADPRNEAHAIRQVSDGSYVLTGWATSPYPDLPYACFVNLSAGGEILWSKKLQLADPPFPFSGSMGFDVKETEEGFVSLASDAYADYVLLIGLDPGGTIILFATYRSGMSGFSPNLFHEIHPKLSPTPSGNWVYVTMGQWGGLYQSDEAGNGIWSRTLMIEVADLIVTRDSGLLVIGNGPLWGVSDPYDYNLQIGLLKTDSEGNDAENCAWEENIPSSFFSAELVTLSMDTTLGATVSTLQVTTTESGLSYYQGCVETTPGIPPSARESVQILLSPNPTSGQITIHQEPDRDPLYRLEIYDITGHQVYLSSSPHPLPIELDLSSLPPGIYLVRMLGGDKWYSKKIILIR